MGRPTTRPLSPEEAKARLRLAASDLGLQAWARRRPYVTVLVGLVGGLLLGSAPHAAQSARRLTRLLAGLKYPP